MKNQYAISLLVFTALTCHMPTKAMEKPEKWYGTKHVFALLDLLDREGEEDSKNVANMLPNTFPPPQRQEGHQPVAFHSESDEDDHLAEAVRLSLMPDFGNPLYQEEGEVKRAIDESLLLSGMQQETPPLTPKRDWEDEKEAGLDESSWHVIDSGMEDPWQEEARKQQEGPEKKEALEREIAEFYPKIKQTYEEYKGIQVEESKIQSESNAYPFDSEERNKGREKCQELSSRKLDIYRAFEGMKKEEDDRVRDYLSLLSGERKETFEKKVEDSRLLLKELREKIEQKNQEEMEAWRTYSDAGREDKDGLRQYWLDLYDQHKGLQEKWDETVVNESKVFHEYFLAIVFGVIENAGDKPDSGMKEEKSQE